MLGGLTFGAPVAVLRRDLFLDTSDGTLEEIGAELRLRLEPAAGAQLRLAVQPRSGHALGQRTIYESTLDDAVADHRVAWRGASSAARAVRALVDPDRLEARLELEARRQVRGSGAGLEATFETIHARSNTVEARLRQLTLAGSADAQSRMQELAEVLERDHGLRHVYVKTGMLL